MPRAGNPLVGAFLTGLALTGLALTQAQLTAESPLGEPNQPIDRLVPESLFDSITLPEQPVRVASRPKSEKKAPTGPKLDWRPGLKEASDGLKSDTGEQPAKAPLVALAKAPKLVAPKSETTPAEKPAAEKKTAKKIEQKIAETRERAIKKTPTESTKAEDQSAEDQPESSGQLTQATPAADPPEPLSRGMKSLRSRMRTVLSFYYRKPFNTVQNDPWELMHGMLAYELHSRVRDGGPNSKPITAIGHLCFNRPAERMRMMRIDKEGRLNVRIGVGVQGHSGQFLAMLAQCNVSPDYPIKVSGKSFTIQDLVEAEQLSCYSKTELTFKLIGLGHYLDSDAVWLNDRGETWSIPKLIEEELAQPIRGAACGGTHRLAGLSLACRRREARDEPVDGSYKKAADFVEQYHGYAFRLQNSDGSLSTEWFRGNGREEDIERRLRTTGHTLEWLSYSLTDDELRSQGAVRAATYLTNLLAKNANMEWHPGSLAHALHALVLYDKRVFQPHDEPGPDGLFAGDTINPSSHLYRGYSIYRGVMRNGAPQQHQGFFGLFGSSQSRRQSGYQN